MWERPVWTSFLTQSKARRLFEGRPGRKSGWRLRSCGTDLLEGRALTLGIRGQDLSTLASRQREGLLWPSTEIKGVGFGPTQLPGSVMAACSVLHGEGSEAVQRVTPRLMNLSQGWLEPAKGHPQSTIQGGPCFSCWV